MSWWGKIMCKEREQRGKFETKRKEENDKGTVKVERVRNQCKISKNVGKTGESAVYIGVIREGEKYIF
jgi:hypothetical protein